MYSMVKIRDKIKYIKTKDLKKYANNNKKHSDKQIKLLKENIERFGFTTPLLVDSKNGEIIAGHGRALAAEDMGIEKLPYIDVSDLSKKNKRALRIADNKIGELATWDLDSLRIELGELNRDGLLELTGFDLSDLNVFGNKGDFLVEDLEKEWDGMPEYDQEDLKPFQQIIISFKNKEDREEFAELVGSDLTDKTKSVWYPKQEIDKVEGIRY